MRPAALMKRLPTADALVVYFDFAALRRAGVLSLVESQKAGADPEYQDFVRKTGFDYQRDLDTAIAAFAPTGKYLLLHGRFDWDRLRSYVQSEGGRCDGELCRVAGSTPDRQISFSPLGLDWITPLGFASRIPLRGGWMALAVSQDESAALRMQNENPSAAFGLPVAPVWLSIPSAVLKSGESLPTGTRPFARNMANADSVILSFAPDANRLAAKLDVRCHSNQDAAELVSQLSRTTELLRAMIVREHHTPNPADLSGVLTSGSFRNEGPRVFGYWPIERAFLENLIGGQS